jgi:DNA topoisomerase III
MRDFVPLAYFEIVAAAKVAGEKFQMRHTPHERILKHEIAGTSHASCSEGLFGAGTRGHERQRG